MPLKCVPRSKSGASKSRPRWEAHTRKGKVWEYPHPRGWTGLSAYMGPVTCDLHLDPPQYWDPSFIF